VADALPEEVEERWRRYVSSGGGGVERWLCEGCAARGGGAEAAAAATGRGGIKTSG
jgi:hypothetical protein